MNQFNVNSSISIAPGLQGCEPYRRGRAFRGILIGEYYINQAKEKPAQKRITYSELIQSGLVLTVSIKHLFS